MCRISKRQERSSTTLATIETATTGTREEKR